MRVSHRNPLSQMALAGIVRAVLALGMFTSIFTTERGVPGSQSHTVYTIACKLLLCVVLFHTASLCKILLARMMAAHFHKSAFFEKMHDALRKVAHGQRWLHTQTYLHTRKTCYGHGNHNPHGKHHAAVCTSYAHLVPLHRLVPLNRLVPLMFPPQEYVLMALSQPRRATASEDGGPDSPSTHHLGHDPKHHAPRSAAAGWVSFLWDDAVQRLRSVATRPGLSGRQWRQLHDSHGGEVAIPMEGPSLVSSRQASASMGGRPSSPSWRLAALGPASLAAGDACTRPTSPRPGGGPWAGERPLGLAAWVARVFARLPGRRKGPGGGGSAQTLYRDVLRLHSKVWQLGVVAVCGGGCQHVLLAELMLSLCDGDGDGNGDGDGHTPSHPHLPLDYHRAVGAPVAASMTEAVVLRGRGTSWQPCTDWRSTSARQSSSSPLQSSWGCCATPQMRCGCTVLTACS